MAAVSCPLIALVYFLALGVQDGSTACQNGYVSCLTGDQCVRARNWCDNYEDCNDGSDEKETECLNFTCVDGKRKCADNLQCMYSSYWCDGDKDCTDGSDEEFCPTKTVCLSMGFDISESLDDPSHLAQETAFLQELWTELNNRFEFYRFIMTFIPFNHKVLADDVVTISSKDAASKAAFLEAEIQAFNGIKNKISNTETSGLTNLEALTESVIGQACSEGLSVLFILSDFIFTDGKATDPATIKNLLDDIQNKSFVVVAVGLNKERLESNFDEAGDAPRYKIDLTDNNYVQKLTEVLDEILPLPPQN